MKIFLDSADINEIKTYIDTGFVDGVTTNPSLIAKSGRNILEAISEICSLVDGPVSAEVAATDYETMIAEGRKLAKLADNVTVKVPLTEDGLRTCRTLSDEGTDVNVTLCFTAGQALLAAKAGATFISPFVGRLDDIGQDGMGLIGKSSPSTTSTGSTLRSLWPRSAAPSMWWTPPRWAPTSSPCRRKSSARFTSIR